MPRRQKGNPSITTLKRKLDDLWSKYIRLSEAHSDGRCSCVSCGASANWKDMDCGHFISRNHNGGRFLRENCHAQCKKCNRFREGNKAGYAVFLTKQYGPEIIDRLNQLQYQIRRFTVAELQEQVVWTKNELARLNNQTLYEGKQ